MPPAVPRRPQAAESKPPRAGQRTAFFHRCPARPEKRGPERRRHGTRPKRTTARAPERGPRPSLPPGRWGAPGQPITAPRTALSLAGGAAPPARRAAAKTDRGRPATAHGGPGPTPPGPDNHQPPGARARRGAARASRAIFMPPQGTRRGAIAPGRDGGAGHAARPGGTDGAEVRSRSRGHPWPGVGRLRERKKERGRSPSQFVTPPRGTRFAPVPRSSRPHIPHRPALHRPSSP